MKAYELLYINRNTLRIMSEMSLDASDIKYLEMYKDYTRLTAEGHKKAYIMQYLADVNPEKPDVPLNKNDAFQKVQKRRVQEKR